MKRVFAALLLLPAVASAQFTYDPQTGNSYVTTPSYGGGAQVRGYNLGTGSNWNTTVQPNGDMRGMDADGNTWRYNNSSGSYMNSNGTICTGKGVFRNCY